MKLHAGPELEFPTLEIGVMPPGDRQGRPGLRRLADCHQRIEYQPGEIVPGGWFQRHDTRFHFYTQDSAIVRTRGGGEQTSDRK